MKAWLLGVVLGLGMLVGTPAWAASWSCQNTSLEVQCKGKTCEATETFTPVQLSVDAKGSLSMCAYSGCWEGKGKVLQSGSHVLVSVPKAKRTQSPKETASIMLAIHSEEKIGLVQGLGFAMPVVCQ